ncbi:MAG: M23 family metallopeptidase [Thermodesulfobacteriota bacterium]|nr:M23 family metallopeptidase [Thermodesulfobacteriota bacterium]
MKKNIFIIFVLLVILPLIWFLTNQFERKPPGITVDFPSIYLSKSYEISLMASDKGTGLREVRVSIVQQEKEKVLLKKEYPCIGYKGFFMGSKIFNDSFKIPVESRKYGMVDGEALIKIYVSDYSWKEWNSGNKVYQEKKVVIDSKPPGIEILSRRHNIARGGAGLVIYRLFEDGIKSGVKVEDNFFPGYSGMFEDKNIFASFFALSYKQGPGVKIAVTASDPTGNTATRGFYYYIRDTKFKTDLLKITDKFLLRKMPEFDLGAEEAAFDSADNPLLKKFIYINRVLRKKNIKDLLKPVVNTAHKVLWEGRFSRLPGSANRASFADHRIYKYNGKEIDRQIHMGIDLASVYRAPVPVANNGKVLSTDNIGIFGNSVLIDHGFGLCTVYSHLTTVLVQKGDMVKKGDIIGKSGATGLAGGDHLHFGVSVNNVFVNPLEWWDKTWIKNNILSKIQNVEKLQ